MIFFHVFQSCMLFIKSNMFLFCFPEVDLSDNTDFVRLPDKVKTQTLLHPQEDRDYYRLGTHTIQYAEIIYIFSSDTIL